MKARMETKTSVDIPVPVLSVAHPHLSDSANHNIDAAELQAAERWQKKAGRAHEKGAQTGDNAIGRAQVGRTLAFAIEDQELMFDEHRFGNHATGTSRHCQSGAR